MTCTQIQRKEHRRKILLGGAAYLVHAFGNSLAGTVRAEPQARLSLSTFGGMPGASPARLKDAFSKAFEQLRAVGGGELIVPAGKYDFGSCNTGINVVAADDLRDVFISAYGAKFRLHTKATVVPCLFYFSNPTNVTLAGASFTDTGYDPKVDWRGMYCVRSEASRESSGFRMVDCHADGAVGLFQSMQNDESKYLMKRIRLHATLKNVYYGAGLTYVGEHADIDLDCENVRRGCIAYGLRNASIAIRMKHAAGAMGSNGFICLISEGARAGNVENIRIRLMASGAAAHSGLIHFYHQQKEAQGSMRNIHAEVMVNNLSGEKNVKTNIFVFDHETPDATILSSTRRQWDGIHLSGRVNGELSGRVIHNPSVSTSPGAIYLAPELAARADMSTLPKYFHVKAA